MKKLVIIPTYNEKDSISILLSRVSNLNVPDLDVLVVDDNSPDGTAEEVEKKMKQDSDIFLKKREGKLGLSSAYIDGFNWGIDREYDVLVQMDADLSHDPAYLPNLLEEIENGSDVVVGSRYVNKGGVANWNCLRKFISKAGCLYAKMILNTNVNDMTGGFNAWSINTLEDINLEEIKSEGYAFQIEMKYRSLQEEKVIKEIPIIFKDRTGGVSKMSKRIVFEAVWVVWWLRFFR